MVVQLVGPALQVVGKKHHPRHGVCRAEDREEGGDSPEPSAHPFGDGGRLEGVVDRLDTKAGVVKLVVRVTERYDEVVVELGRLGTAMRRVFAATREMMAST
jgi:hypothetical protein